MTAWAGIHNMLPKSGTALVTASEEKNSKRERLPKEEIAASWIPIIKPAPTMAAMICEIRRVRFAPRVLNIKMVMLKDAAVAIAPQAKTTR